MAFMKVLGPLNHYSTHLKGHNGPLKQTASSLLVPSISFSSIYGCSHALLLFFGLLSRCRSRGLCLTWSYLAAERVALQNAIFHSGHTVLKQDAATVKRNMKFSPLTEGMVFFSVTAYFLSSVNKELVWLCSMCLKDILTEASCDSSWRFMFFF